MFIPEGTRVAPGTQGVYQAGGAWIAAKTGTPVLPVAHNAGTFWPRKAFVKRPGLITVSIGPLVHAEGEKPAVLMQNIASWIENETRQIREDERADEAR